MIRSARRFWPALLIPVSLAIALLIYDPFIYLVTVVHLFAIPALAYPLVYRKSPWKNGTTGRALMNMARAVALLFFIPIIGFWWPVPGYDYIYAVIVTYLGAALTFQLHVMFRLKRSANSMRQP